MDGRISYSNHLNAQLFGGSQLLVTQPTIDVLDPEIELK
jgi:hypothetical protein